MDTATKIATVEDLEQEVRDAQADLNLAQSMLDERKGELAAARQDLYRRRQSERDTRIAEATDEMFYAENPTHDVRGYVLPFGREYGKWSPWDVDNAPFGKSWLGGMYGIICLRTDEARTRPSRLIFSSGSPLDRSEFDKIDQRFTARHDQTNAKLGEYTIVGLVIWDADGDVLRVVGDVPDVKYSQNTYK